MLLVPAAAAAAVVAAFTRAADVAGSDSCSVSIGRVASPAQHTSRWRCRRSIECYGKTNAAEGAGLWCCGSVGQGEGKDQMREPQRSESTTLQAQTPLAGDCSSRLSRSLDVASTCTTLLCTPLPEKLANWPITRAGPYHMITGWSWVGKPCVLLNQEMCGRLLLQRSWQAHCSPQSHQPSLPPALTHLPCMM